MGMAPCFPAKEARSRHTALQLPASQVWTRNPAHGPLLMASAASRFAFKRDLPTGGFKFCGVALSQRVLGSKAGVVLILLFFQTTFQKGRRSLS